MTRHLSMVLLVLPAVLGAAQLQIDHATVCGADLKQMQAALTQIGIPSEYGGPHSNHATEMALTSFPDGSYLEQIAIQPKGDAKAIQSHEWSKQMKGNSGPCAWAVRPSDMGAEVKRLQGRIQVTAPERAGRNRPDGTRLDWETSQVGAMVRGTFFPFLIRDLTPREARAYPSGKPTTTEFSGVAKVVIGVHDLEDSIARYRKTYELRPNRNYKPMRAFGAKLAWFEGIACNSGCASGCAVVDGYARRAVRRRTLRDNPESIEGAQIRNQLVWHTSFVVRRIETGLAFGISIISETPRTAIRHRQHFRR